ncbi:MAG: DUF1847 domain-containing protein [Spirochaetia bacterium]|nr:DUF1847 domain-containing protein [Spirochaetia bacterium]
MNCITCASKKCRSAHSCGAESFDLQETLQQYHLQEAQDTVQAAAQLVDGGRAGTLSRMQELIEFIHSMHYQNVGLAYCYGMEQLAGDVRELLRQASIRAVGVSCTVGGVSQSAINDESTLEGVSCNPINQAAQLDAQGVDLAVVIGLCLGHDVIFNRTFSGDVTTLVVKDRVYDHAPVRGIEALSQQ